MPTTARITPKTASDKPAKSRQFALGGSISDPASPDPTKERSPLEIYKSEAAIRGLDSQTFEPAAKPPQGGTSLTIGLPLSLAAQPSAPASTGNPNLDIYQREAAIRGLNPTTFDKSPPTPSTPSLFSLLQPGASQPSRMGLIGFANGGEIQGPGTPTSDSIPAQVRQTGEPIQVSTDERILSKAQNGLVTRLAKQMGFPTLDAMLEAGTGKPVGPTIKGGSLAAALGMAPEEDKNPLAGLHGDLPQGVTMSRDMAGQPVYSGGISAGRTKPDVAPLSAAAATQPRSLVESPFDRPSGNPLIAGIGDYANTSASQQAIGQPPRVAGIRDPGPAESQSFDNFLTRSTLQSALESVAKSGSPKLLQTLPGIASGINQASGQIPAKDLARDTLKQQGEIKTQEIAQNADRLSQKSMLDGLRLGLDNRRADQADQRIGIQQQRADAASTRAENAGNPTLAQQRSNLEIDAARQRIAGMSPEEIRKRTQQFSATGRENPDYDPTLAKAVILGGRRMVGDDPVFDGRQQGQTPQAQGYDLSTRFQSDKAMAGHRLGKQTDLGTEVYDANGRLIGHYN